MNSKVSFTIRPPTSSKSSELQNHTHSRSYELSSQSFIPHAHDSSDEDDQDGTIEHIVGFDRSGAQRVREIPKFSQQLVIPALANRDWRAAARTRGKPSYIPEGSDLVTGRDGSQGGLGTRDTINSGPQAVGLIRREQKAIITVDATSSLGDSGEVSVETLEQVESEDERARRALLANIAGDAGEERPANIDIIPISANNVMRPMDETEAYKQDVVTRPDSASLADYERVPVSQFGAALLRGMGWKEGTAASRTRTGIVEPWLPSSRPALLGLGAKERPAEEIPVTSGKKAHKSQRPEKRYVPVVRLHRVITKGSDAPPPSRSRSISPGRSTVPSRLPSPVSASPYPNSQDSDRQRRDRNRGRYDDESGHSRSERELGRDRYTDRHDRKRDRDPRGDPKRDERSRSDREHRHSDRDRSSRDYSSRH
ncbi:DExH-box splicing factor binding site-domain-containing protein [Hysterangium stoloniferum]|nr:DExH-box splicing factor binding site-domain-containing protein [Hysterangium stoloniferum]